MLDTTLARSNGHRFRRRRGMSILEMSIAIVIFSLLVGSVMNITTDTMAYASHAEAIFDVQHEAMRASNRTAEILRKTGWNDDGVADYPLVNADRDEIRFRMLNDFDGNGFPFDADTGELEWSPLVLAIRRDPDDRTLYVYDGDTPVWTLGRHVDSVRFETFVEDNALNLRQVRMTVSTSDRSSDGTTLSYTSTSNIFMRN